MGSGGVDGEQRGDCGEADDCVEDKHAEEGEDEPVVLPFPVAGVAHGENERALEDAGEEDDGEAEGEGHEFSPMGTISRCRNFNVGRPEFRGGVDPLRGGLAPGTTQLCKCLFPEQVHLAISIKAHFSVL